MHPVVTWSLGRWWRCIIATVTTALAMIDTLLLKMNSFSSGCSCFLAGICLKWWVKYWITEEICVEKFWRIWKIKTSLWITKSFCSPPTLLPCLLPLWSWHFVWWCEKLLSWMSKVGVTDWLVGVDSGPSCYWMYLKVADMPPCAFWCYSKATRYPRGTCNQSTFFLRLPRLGCILCLD